MSERVYNIEGWHEMENYETVVIMMGSACM